MKSRFNLFFFLILLIAFLSSCEDTKKSESMTKSEPSTPEHISPTAAIENQEEVIDPTIIDSTIWKNYMSVSIGDADYKGRYSYQYEIYSLKNGEKKKIANSELFNNKLDELEKIINDKIKIEYDISSTDQETKDCFDGSEYKKYSINEMGIEFDKKNNIIFNGGFGLSGACFSVDYFSIKMPLDSMSNYLAE